MIKRDPDITRLLDRLEARGLVTRGRDRADRRVITTRVTAEGLQVLKRLDGATMEFPRRRMGHLGAERLRSLTRLLDLLRPEDEA
jgi:DNA-binding MarR family transcriptional regulator